jgi:hypothetical protein
MIPTDEIVIEDELLTSKNEESLWRIIFNELPED